MYWIFYLHCFTCIVSNHLFLLNNSPGVRLTSLVLHKAPKAEMVLAEVINLRIHKCSLICRDFGTKDNINL